MHMSATHWLTWVYIDKLVPALDVLQYVGNLCVQSFCVAEAWVRRRINENMRLRLTSTRHSSDILCVRLLHLLL